MIKKVISLLCFLSVITLPSKTQTFFSVGTHFAQFGEPMINQQTTKVMLEYLSEMGVEIIRDDCNWWTVEWRKSFYNFPREYDYFVSEALKKNIQVMLIIDYNNPIYLDGVNDTDRYGISDENNRQAYVNYCKKVVQHFAPMGVKYYEIWNEPNFNHFWLPVPNTKHYFELLKESYTAIKEVDSSAIIVGCSAAPFEHTTETGIAALEFIDSLFAMGAANYLDVVSVHKYNSGDPPENYIPQFISDLKDIIGEKPIFLDEFGYYSYIPESDLGKKKPAWITRAYLLGKGIENLDMLSYYTLKDESPDTSFGGFGLLDYNLTPKRSYYALKNLFKLIQKKELSNIIEQDSCYLYTFKDSLSEVKVGWSTSQNGNIFTTLSQGSYFRLNLFGEKVDSLVIENENAGYTFAVSTEPSYIIKKDYYLTDMSNTDLVFDYQLYQNYPNPFNPSTKIQFTIPAIETARRVVSTKLIVYDILGREMKILINKNLTPGNYDVEFYGKDLPSGIYFYKLSSGSFAQTKKMMLIR